MKLNEKFQWGEPLELSRKKIAFIFNWRIIALQCSVSFCYTIT